MYFDMYTQKLVNILQLRVFNVQRHMLEHIFGSNCGPEKSVGCFISIIFYKTYTKPQRYTDIILGMTQLTKETQKQTQYNKQLQLIPQ